MAIQFRCPSCQTLLSTSSHQPGSVVNCPRCAAKMHVPPTPLPIATPVAGPPPPQSNHGPASDPFASIVHAPDPLQESKAWSASPTTTRLIAAGASVGLFLILGLAFHQFGHRVKRGTVDPAKSHAPASNAAVRSTAGQPGDIRSIPVVRAILGDAPSPEWEVVKRYVLRNSLKPDDIHFEKWFPAKDASPNDSNAFEVKSREDPKIRARLDELDRLIQTVPRPVEPPALPMGMGVMSMGPNRPLGDIFLLSDGRRVTKAEYRRMRAEHQRMATEFREDLNEYMRKRNEYETEKASTAQGLYVRYKVMTADRVVRVITRTDVPILGMLRTDDFYYLKDGKVVDSKSGTPADQDKLIELYYLGED